MSLFPNKTTKVSGKVPSCNGLRVVRGSYQFTNIFTHRLDNNAIGILAIEIKYLHATNIFLSALGSQPDSNGTAVERLCS